jgi:hypothetical protein
MYKQHKVGPAQQTEDECGDASTLPCILILDNNLR